MAPSVTLREDTAAVEKDPSRRAEYQKGEVFGKFRTDASMDHPIFGNYFDPPTTPFWEVQAIRKQSNAATNPNPADELLSYLIRTRHRHATDPRDKLYSALGFTDGKLKALEIVPDYRLPHRDVYRDVTRRLIEVSGNLDVLGLCFPFKKLSTSGLPSWVPDWGPAERIAQPLMSDAHGNPRKAHALASVQHHYDDVKWDDDFNFDDRDGDPWY
ncbi:uncharacterized protein P884DRAFT_280392 [Thermothelomyces heterothallicus CBS 202.75]|uniref:uncharacterized protein n=1 Tax=Thermothelomyces heterothallicus CBS 202.75 TaxID=1149848 RepID=UPI0037421C8E